MRKLSLLLAWGWLSCSPPPGPAPPRPGLAASEAGAALGAAPRFLAIPIDEYLDAVSTTRARVSALAVDGDASHAYLGVQINGVARARVLAAITREGAAFSRVPRYFPLADRDLDPNALVRASEIVVSGRRLYVLWSDMHEASLSTYDLDPGGEPLPGSLKVFSLGGFGLGVSGRLAFHPDPSLRLAYVTTEYAPELGVLALDERGLPVPSRPGAPNPRLVDLEHFALGSMALSHDGGRLLVGARPDVVLDVALHPANHPDPSLRGMPREWKPRVAHPPAGAPCPENAPPEGKQAPSCTDTSYAFVSTGASLYRRYGFPLALRGRLPLERLDLPGAVRGPEGLGASSYALAFDGGAREGAPRGILWSADARRVRSVDGRSLLAGAEVLARDPDTGRPLALPGAPPIAVGFGQLVSYLAVAPRTGTVVGVIERADEPNEEATHGEIARGYAVRLTVTKTSTPTDPARFPALPAKVHLIEMAAATVGRDPEMGSAAIEAVGKPSDWISLDPALGGKGARSHHPLQLFHGSGPDLSADNTELAPTLEASPYWSLKIDFGHKEADGTYRVLRSAEDGPIYGRSTTFFVPGYDVSVFDPARFETLTEASRRWRGWALAGKATRRHRQNGVICHGILAHGSVEFARNLAETLGNLGCNELATDYPQHLPRSWIFEQFTRAGLERANVKYIGGLLDSSRDFLSDALSSDFGQDSSWAAKQFADEEPGSLRQRQGAPVSAMRTLVLDDEPAWELKTKGPLLEACVKSARSRTAFRSWIARQAAGARPADLGWSPRADEAIPEPAKGAHSTPQSRRRFYWTVRYFQTAAATRMLDVSDSIERAVLARPACADPSRCDYLVGVNWSNSSDHRTTTWFDVGTERGYYDWFETMRVQAARPGRERGTSAPRSFAPWFDSKYTDSLSFLAAYRADVARSAAQLPHLFPGAAPSSRTRLGVHITVGMGVPMRDGLSYKVLANAARGARAIEYWAFGPQWILPDDGWSEVEEQYSEVARANSWLGRADTLLAEGERPRARVAIQVEGASGLWSNEQSAHLHEPAFLHAALTHAGYPVDFVDDESLARGALPGHYDVLFLTQIQTSTRAQEAVARWVEGEGGTLVALPGAGTRSEFDERTSRLDRTLGATARSDATVILPVVVPGTADYERQGILTPEPGVPASWKVPPWRILRPRCEKPPCTAGQFSTTADILARVGKEPELSLRRWPGGGQALLYGFHPGLQHWLSQDARSVRTLPTGFAREAREWAALAVANAERARPPGTFRVARSSVPGVEVAPVVSKKGTALLLFNWTGAPLPGGVVTLTLTDRGPFALAFRDDRIPVALKPVAEGVELTVPLDTVEIVRLCRDRSDPDCR